MGATLTGLGIDASPAQEVLRDFQKDEVSA
jgi:hypothetical protein